MTRAIRSCCILLVWLAQSARADDILFNRDIRPILTNNCSACHGPDARQRQAELRLDVREVALEKKAIVPGKPDESELISRIFSDDADTRMPPAESNKSLTQKQKDLLRQWIANGAEYQGHWAFEPVMADVPEGAAGIDELVERDLVQAGLAFSAEADRRTLIRRLSFDLVGLPPTPQDVAAFLADHSPDAYDKVVAKLLASPHYGERMAIAWLDVARFADTIGYHSDNPRNVWPYREYVINAFNNNMPFDRFTTEQLAGDLLPGSTQEQKVASCFNRLLLTTEEGGAQAKDYEARMLTDRVRAVGTVWLGLTTGCCQCHDHKFDPLTSRDFYSLGAFFADIQEPIIGDPGPGLLVPNEEQSREHTRLQTAAADLRQYYNAESEEVVAARAAWEQQVRDEDASAALWTALHPESAVSEKGVTLAVEKDESLFVDRTAKGGVDTYTVTVKTQFKDITGFRIDTLPDQRLPSQGPGRAGNGNFVLSEVTVTRGDSMPVAFSSAAASFEQIGLPASAAIDGQSPTANGWAVAGGAGRQSSIVFELAEPIGTGEEMQLTFVITQNHGDNHTLGKFRLSATTVPGPVPVPRAPLPPQEILEIVRKPVEQRDAAQKTKVDGHFRSITPLLAEERGQLAAAEKALADYEATLPRCLVSTALPTPRTVRILPRGNWQDESGEVVQPALPAFLANSDPDASSVRVNDESRRLTRLDLAEWIVSPENPLTARVFVNRLWKQFFGIALSKNTDDLGSQGEWPVHPELLDWLAREFRDSGWDVKHVVRTIVTSRTYRQTSIAGPELLARDPDNRLLARQSRYRLDAELVRDNALSISGLLVPKVGGPSVKPYQPEGYWENLNFPPRTYVADTGPDEYRRGLYTWWQRTFTHPSMLAFDATSREECTADRTRSNIPQQALVLLNDPTYVEAARVFAARIVKDGGDSAEARITWAYQQTLQRDPRADELALLRQVHEKHKAGFVADASAADELLKVGQTPVPENVDKADLAAWTSVARVLLNLHETITRN